MQYVICFVLVICGLIFVRNRFLTAALLIFDLILLAFLRGGADYDGYRAIYATSSFVYVAGSDIEIGFQFLCAFFHRVLHLDYEVFQFFIGAVPMLLIFSTIRRYTKNQAMVLALFTLFPLLLSAIQIRNLLSFSIVFWGIRFLESKKVGNLVKYGLCVLVASTIHTSSLYYFVFYLFLIEDNKKLFTIVLAWCLIGRFLILPIGLRIIQSFARYGMYLSGRFMGVLTQLCSFLVLLVNYVLARMMYGCVEIYEERSQENERPAFNVRSIQFAKLTMKINIIAFTSWPFFALTSEAMRFVRYLMLFNYILYSLPTRLRIKVDKQYLLRLGICMMACFFMWYYCCLGRNWLRVFRAVFESNQLLGFLTL